MYVCICNAMSERTVREAIDRGCRTVGDIYRDHGVRPRCGKCCSEVARFIQRQDEASTGLWPVAAE